MSLTKEQLFTSNPVAPEDQEQKTPRSPYFTLNPGGGGTSGIPVDSDRAQELATKYHQTLGENSPGIDKIHYDLVTNGGIGIRNLAASIANSKRGTEFYSDAVSLLGSENPEERNLGKQLTAVGPEEVTPEVAIETEWADLLMRDQLNDPTWSSEGLTEEQAVAFEIFKEHTRDSLIRDEIISNAWDRITGEWSQLNTIIKAGDILLTFVPFLTTARTNLALDLSNEGRSLLESLLTGETLDDQIAALYRMPTSEFNTTFNQIVDRLNFSSPTEAMNFINYVMAWRRSDVSMENIFSLADLPIVTALTAGPKVISRALTRTARMRQVLEEAGMLERVISGVPEVPLSRRSTEMYNRRVNVRVQEAMDRLERGADAATRRATPQEISAVSGDLRAAAVAEVASELGEIIPQNAKRTRQLGESVRRRFGRRAPSTINVEEAFRGGDSLFTPARNQTAWIADILDRLPVYNIARMSAEQITRAIPRAIEVMEREVFRNVDNSIFAIQRNLAENSQLNVDTLDIFINNPIGGGTMFKDMSEAGRYARQVLQLPKGSYEIVGPSKAGKGWQDGWAIKKTISVDETQDWVRRYDIARDDRTRTPWGGAFLGSIRSASDWLGRGLRQSRKALEHYQTKLNEDVKDLAKAYDTLGKEEKRQFESFLRHVAQNALDPGIFKKQYIRPREFESAFYSLFGVLPSKKQKAVYENWVRTRQLDWTIRNIAVHKAKMRQGISKIELLRQKGQDPITFEGRRFIKSDDFRNQVSGEEVIMTYDKNGNWQTFRWDQMPEKDRKRIIEGMDNGDGDMVRITNYLDDSIRKDKTINGTTGLNVKEVVDYVFTKEYRTAKLDPEQVPWTPGGTEIYNYKWYLRQSRRTKIGSYGRDTDFGEIVLGGSVSSREANQMARHFNKALEIYQTEKKAGSTTFTQFVTYVNTHLPHVDANDLIKNLQSNALLAHRKIEVTRVGETIASSTRADMRGVKDLNENADIGVGFGSVEKPLYPTSNQDVINPIATINRQLRSALQTVHTADMVTRTAEQFVKEFSSVLQYSKQVQARHPTAVLFGDDSMFIKNPTPSQATLINRAKAVRWATRNMLGHPTRFQMKVRELEDKIFESVHGTSMGKISVEINGKKISLADVSARSIEGLLTDAWPFMRAVAFKNKLGLFNPLQLFKQAQTAIVSSAITGNPVRAMQTAVSSPVFGVLLQTGANSKLLRSMGEKLRFLGWDADSFEEFFHILDNSGIGIVRGEHALRDRWMDAKIGQNAAGKFLDWGDTFFKMGEGYTRINALAIAYREWKKINKGKPVDRAGREWMMDRSGDLTANMTHSANAQWQRGFLAAPTQFFSYQIRLMELFWGNRLKFREKIRLIFTMSLMYGVPMGFGGTVFGIWPWQEEYKKYMAENNPEALVNPSAFDTAISSGLFGFIGQLISGGDPTNAAEVYGPAGLTFFRDLLVGDETTLEFLLGAAGSVLGEIWEDSYPIRTWAREVFFGEGSFDTFDWSHVGDLFRSITSVNNAVRTAFMINTHQYIRSNGELPLADAGEMTNGEIFNYGFFGISPAAAEYEYIFNQREVDFNGARQSARDQIIRYARRIGSIMSNPSISDTEQETQLKEISNQMQIFVAAGGFTESETYDIIRSVLSEMGDGVVGFLQSLARRTTGGPERQERNISTSGAFMERIRNQ